MNFVVFLYTADVKKITVTQGNVSVEFKVRNEYKNIKYTVW
ncbi:hypothetical protein [Clostridium beijerinckii]|jgi:inosine-uridine nucleoside N-ribohydrolase|nr:hypothetical protein [Clostridium beijerinckii]NOW34602.1 inosine-uridine nucleoside N-ribohydrolase [Clostridium beijerinckii]NOW84350.1 inosine-uridine nucleoside N-ribohydrolase [Clostridium beijerinckii]